MERLHITEDKREIKDFSKLPALRSSNFDNRRYVVRRTSQPLEKFLKKWDVIKLFLLNAIIYKIAQRYHFFYQVLMKIIKNFKKSIFFYRNLT